jgi:hypothetical protein
MTARLRWSRAPGWWGELRNDFRDGGLAGGGKWSELCPSVWRAARAWYA